MVQLSLKCSCFIRGGNLIEGPCLVLCRRVYCCDTTLYIPYYIIHRWRGAVRAVAAKLFSDKDYHKVVKVNSRVRKKIIAKVYFLHFPNSVGRTVISVCWGKYRGEITLSESEFSCLNLEMPALFNMMRSMESAHVQHVRMCGDQESILM